MEVSSKRLSPFLPIIFAFAFFIQNFAYVSSIGVNYGTAANNLPPPAQVAQFLKDKTIIDRVRIFDVNPDIIRAFANTGILLTVQVPNDDIPKFIDLRFAHTWVKTNIKPFYPATKINYIAVGNEVLHWGSQSVVNNLVGAMKNLHQALKLEGIPDIKVSTPHALSILDSAGSPSVAKFRPGWDVGILAPMLQFLRETKSPFMVNPHPHYGFDPQNLNFSIFLPSKGYSDINNKVTYLNRFDLLLDNVYSAMSKLGFSDVEIVATATGWPSAGDTPQCTVQNAAAYNGGLLKKYNSNVGTPLMKDKKIEIYISSLFSENLKPGSLTDKSWGLFSPDFKPVYDIGLLRAPQVPVGPPAAVQGKKWCVPKQGVSDATLGSNINYVCSQGVDCTAIQPGHDCFEPNTPWLHASYVMNLWYKTKGRFDYNCDFSGSGVLTTVDPSTGKCRLLA